MDIIKTKIKNYRSIKKIEFEFNPKLNIFVGINGSGKTTVLDALIISLSWLINRIQRENAPGKHISENDIRNTEPYSTIETFIKISDKTYNWKLSKTKKGETAKEKSELSEVSQLADYLRKELKQKNKLPVIVYYPVNRVVKDISPEISSKDNFYILDVYKNAIGVKANFQSFFEWFKQRDDILNEELSSKNKWLKRNKDWIKAKIVHIISIVKRISILYTDGVIETGYTKRYDIIDVPEILFHDLTTAFDITITDATDAYAIKESEILKNILNILSDIENLFYRMSSYYGFRKNSGTKHFNKYIDLIKKILSAMKDIYFSQVNEKEESRIFSFLWETFHFSFLINLWWLTKKGRNDIESLFKKYHQAKEWYIDNFVDLFIQELQVIINLDIKRQSSATRNYGRELKFVSDAIENFIEGYSNLRIERLPRPQMLVDKNGETFNLEQLSDGEKNLIMLVGDIARRLSIANPDSKNPLKGEGVILIDEVDLHLHPAWQRLVIPKLTELFPNCQFFITTHSPQVLSHVKPENIFLLKNENNELSCSKPEESYGMTIDRVVELIMNEDIRPNDVKNDIDKLFELIERNKILEAKKLLKNLKIYLKTDPEIMRAEMIIRKKEIKKNEIH